MNYSGRKTVLAVALLACAALVWGCVETGAGIKGAPGVRTLKSQEYNGGPGSVSTPTQQSPAEAAAPGSSFEVVARAGQEPLIVIDPTKGEETAPAQESVYDLDLKPLSTPECGRCHFSVFTAIKEEGGKHRLDCTYCHEEFHTYKPGKDWAEVVPACTTCHGAAHGQDYLDCLACHENAHAPVASMVALNQLEPDCAKCHEPQGQELALNPSAHTELSCSSCHHTRHGNIPDCTECHAQPHVAFEDNSGCVGCHPAHAPINIEYGEQVENIVCAGCHQSANTALVNSSKKHTTLSCVYCHAQNHGYIPACQDCHGKPHSEAMLSRFGACTDCHGDPHSLALPGQ